MKDLLFDGENAFKHLKNLAVGLGSRPSGSEAEKRAAEQIAEEFFVPAANRSEDSTQGAEGNPENFSFQLSPTIAISAVGIKLLV